MPESAIERRRDTIAQARTNSALSGFEPPVFALSVFEQWIVGHWTSDRTLALLMAHHQNLEGRAVATDNAASYNKIGITDSACMMQAEADIKMLRMAEIDAEE